MNKVIISLVLLFAVACLAQEDDGCPTNACAAALCPYPSICVEQEVQCVTTPCCKIPVCIPLCGNEICEEDEECVTLPCYTPPCPQRCREKKEDDNDEDNDGCPDDVCAGVRCMAPYTCEEEEVVCVRAPCCKVPKCSCNGDDCEEGEECQELFCINPPCGQRCVNITA